MSDVQNNVKTAGGVTGKGFRPGKSGNPGGRPKGFGAYIREKTLDGRTLVDDALRVLDSKQSSDAARIAARQFLANYGFGKPVGTREDSAPEDNEIQFLVAGVDLGRI